VSLPTDRRSCLPAIFGLWWLAVVTLFGSLLHAQTIPPTEKQSAISPVNSAPVAKMIPPPPGYRFPNGQTYIYSVEWRLFTAGTAQVTMEPAGTNQRVSTIADSAGLVNVLYKIHDRIEAVLDPRTFCSLHVSKYAEEGSRKRRTEIGFDYARGKSLLEEKNLQTGELKHAENDIPSCVTDVISAFYYVASLPLQPGTDYTFAVNDGGKTSDIAVRVEAREQVKVPAGTFQTVRVQAEPISGLLKGKAAVWVWFDADAEHVPVQIRSKLKWGTLLFKLQRRNTQ
jgi:hypothetical protein